MKQFKCVQIKDGFGAKDAVSTLLTYGAFLYCLLLIDGMEKGSVDGREITRRFGNWELLIYTTCLLDVASGRDLKGIRTISVGSSGT